MIDFNVFFVKIMSLRFKQTKIVEKEIQVESSYMDRD
jgi:hypothetical protein